MSYLTQLAFFWYEEEIKASHRTGDPPHPIVRQFALTRWSEEVGGAVSDPDPFWWAKWVPAAARDLSDGQRARVERHVLAVIDGEVRRSEAGAGDLAIWRGRVRSPAFSDELRRVTADRFRTEVVEFLYLHLYDTVERLPSGHWKLFDFGVPGYFKLTNAPEGVVWPFDAYLSSWYVTTPAYRLDDLAAVRARLVVGDKIYYEERLIDLYESPRQLDVLVRERVYRYVELFTEMDRDLEVTVHLEGARNRQVH